MAKGQEISKAFFLETSLTKIYWSISALASEVSKIKKIDEPYANTLKLMISKKATKFDKIFTIDLTLTTWHNVKSTVKILSNFAAFLENTTLPQGNFPGNDLNFHWRWWDQIQAISLNFFYFLWAAHDMV